MLLTNTRILLVNRPNGLPKSTDFRIDQQQQQPINVETMTPPGGGVIIKTLYISIDPAMRGWMSTTKSYLPPIKLNNVMRASSIGMVISTTNHNKFPIGTIVKLDTGGVQTYVIVPSKDTKYLMIIPQRQQQQSQQSVMMSNNKKKKNHIAPLSPSSSSSLASSLSSSAYLGVLGTTGLTAYFGLFKIGLPQKGDVILISGAAGATGSIVAQIAKNVLGCFVIGTAGSNEKCSWLIKNNIVDIAINYKQQQHFDGKPKKSLSRKIREALLVVASKSKNKKKKNKEEEVGADIVFDNVGGQFLEAALSNLAKGARIVLCGAISQYNNNGGDGAAVASANTGGGSNSNNGGGGPRNYMNLLVKRSSMKGFVVFDYRSEYSRAIKDLRKWIHEGKIQYKEHIIHGIENFHTALMTLFDGTNKGKVILQVSSSSLSNNNEEEVDGSEGVKTNNLDTARIQRSKL